MFLKTQNKNVADYLSSHGFNYTTETVNKTTFYCFVHTPELAKIIMSNYADEPFIVDARMRF